MSKKNYSNVKLDNGKTVTVKSVKESGGDRSYEVYGGHSYDSLSSLKSDKNLNDDPPPTPQFMQK